MRALYKYPHRAFPYQRLLDENRRRGKDDPEFELLDTGIFDEDRYFDVSVEYAKATPTDCSSASRSESRPDDAHSTSFPTPGSETPGREFTGISRRSRCFHARRFHANPGGPRRPWPYHLTCEGIRRCCSPATTRTANNFWLNPRHMSRTRFTSMVNGRADAVNPERKGPRRRRLPLQRAGGRRTWSFVSGSRRRERRGGVRTGVRRVVRATHRRSRRVLSPSPRRKRRTTSGSCSARPSPVCSGATVLSLRRRVADWRPRPALRRSTLARTESLAGASSTTTTSSPCGHLEYPWYAAWDSLTRFRWRWSTRSSPKPARPVAA
jgi:hypothetical protein